jgi:hypothetical protein
MEKLNQYWPLITTFILALVWMIRLESKVQEHSEDIEMIRSDKKEEIREINRKLDNMAEELKKICVAFSELSGFIKGRECNDERSN